MVPNYGSNFLDILCKCGTATFYNVFAHAVGTYDNRLTNCLLQYKIRNSFRCTKITKSVMGSGHQIALAASMIRLAKWVKEG